MRARRAKPCRAALRFAGRLLKSPGAERGFARTAGTSRLSCRFRRYSTGGGKGAAKEKRAFLGLFLSNRGKISLKENKYCVQR